MSDSRATPIERWKDNPYAADLGDMDVMAALREGPARIKTMVDGLTPAQMARGAAGEMLMCPPNQIVIRPPGPRADAADAVAR